MKKAEAVKAIERSGHPQGLPVLRALLHGDLHARVENGRFFIVKEKGGKFELIDALSGEVTVTPTKDGLKRVIINNQLRLALRAAVARLSLSNEDPAVRLLAVEEIMSDLDEAALGVLRWRLIPYPRQTPSCRYTVPAQAMGVFWRRDPLTPRRAR